MCAVPMCADAFWTASNCGYTCQKTVGIVHNVTGINKKEFVIAMLVICEVALKINEHKFCRPKYVYCGTPLNLKIYTMVLGSDRRPDFPKIDSFRSRQPREWPRAFRQPGTAKLPPIHHMNA